MTKDANRTKAQLIGELDGLRRKLAAARRLEEEYRRASEEEEREYALREAETAVRLRIAEMDRPEDLGRIVEEINHQLDRLGVEYDAFTIQIVNAAGDDFISLGGRGVRSWKEQFDAHRATLSIDLSRGITWPKATKSAVDYPWVIDVWKTGKPRYVPCTPEGEILHPGFSLIDVPFCQGTLAINRNARDAYDEEEIALLQRIAAVLSNGFQRFLDITSRRQAEETLEREYRLRDSDNAIRLAVASINEPRDLRHVVVEISSQLTRLGMTHDAISLQVVNGEGTAFFSIGLGKRGPAVWNREWDRRHLVVRDGTVSFRSLPDEKLTEEGLRERRTILDVWKKGTFRYQPCTPEGLYGIPSGISIVDVAFSHGTLAINRKQPNAFSADAISLLQRFARIVSEGFQRFLDVTARKQMEQELIRLERLNALGELSVGFCHNFNNILTGIMGPVQLLKRYSDNPKAVREAEAILAGATRARDLVQQLSWAVRREQDYTLCPVAVNEAVQEAVETIRPRWQDQSEAQGIAIEVVIELEDVPAIYGTQSGLNSILTNLIFNAVDAMPEGGTITLRTQVVEEHVQLTVADTGKGMDEETRRRVFEPFFTTKMDIGTGLGLSMVYNTVTRWGGSVDVDSAPEEGTVLSLRFPVWPEEEVEEEGKAAVRSMRPGKLLIVEDDEGACSLLDRLLSETYELEIVLEGREALERFTPGQYDVALLDLGLPGVPGDQIAREMMRLDPAVVTVLITGWDLEPDDPRKDVFDFEIEKPFDDLDEVEDIVARAVALHDERVEKTD